MWHQFPSEQQHGWVRKRLFVAFGKAITEPNTTGKWLDDVFLFCNFVTSKAVSFTIRKIDLGHLQATCLRHPPSTLLIALYLVA